MNNKWIILAAALLASSAYAQSKPPAPGVASTTQLTDGVVRKIDAANNKITLKHGPIANLDMPGMTMVFRVVSPTLLNGIAVGDSVRFHVERRDGAMTITEINPAK